MLYNIILLLCSVRNNFLSHFYLNKYAQYIGIRIEMKHTNKTEKQIMSTTFTLKLLL